MEIQLFIALGTAIISALTSYTLVNWRLKKLEEKVDKHNEYSDKIASITTDIRLLQKDTEYIRQQMEK